EWKWLPTSERRITRDGDPMHTPTLARIIVERAVLGAAVVPDRQRTNLPAESAGKLWVKRMRKQKIGKRSGLGAREPIERLRVIAYVERFAAGLRMGPQRFIIQGTQVDVGDFSAERSCDRLDFDLPIGCHGLAPFVGDTARGQPTGQRQLGSRPACD